MPLPDRLQTGHAYVDGDTVNAANLNAVVNEATALKGFITELPAVTAVPTDYVLISDTSAAGALKQALVSDLPEGVTSVALTMPSGFTVGGSPVTGAGTFAVTMQNQGAGKFFASPDLSTGAPAFRAITSVDLALSPVVIAAYTIDWHLGNVFTKVLPGNAVYTFNHANSVDGQTIKVIIQQQGSGGTGQVAWSATPLLYWRGNGAVPVLTTGPGRRDIFTFTRIGSTTIYGYADQDFAAPH
jgi:hypothetical protein